MEGAREFGHISEEFRVITGSLLTEVIAAGNVALALQKGNLQVEVKSSKDDLVTNADKIVSNKVQTALAAQFQGIKFVDEESQVTHINAGHLDEGIVAIIDPIDGTRNFYEGNPNWGVSVGIMEDGVLVAGIIYQPQTQTLYYAEKGKGAYMNGQLLHVANNGFPHSVMYSFPYASDANEYSATQAVLDRMQAKGIEIKRLGSQVIEVMQVAQGKADAFFHLKTKPWDMAAALCILLEAGGSVYTPQGEPYRLFGESVLMTSGSFAVSSLTGSM